ncbi:hypothetical protein ARMGADRAFT_1089220 [Armillaria gallica]|uniref:Uncharacterized protein n=1 Tax=Armillaria gallica TaxID=47427 RepID=A0A2H3CKJ0_ARMGA|nr:hypothetical protein ARMGADRAFT_1089220 [Armillaria gallica]
MSNSGTAVPSHLDPGLEENGLTQNFLRRLRTGTCLDKAIILAIAEEKVLQHIFALCLQDPVITDPHIGLINVFEAAHDGLWVA